MRKITWAIIIVMIIMVFPINVYADNFIKKVDPTGGFETSEDVTKVLKEYGYTGSFDVNKMTNAKKEGEKQQTIKWKMSKTITVESLAYDANDGGVRRYSLYIDGKRTEMGVEWIAVDSALKNYFKDEYGYIYNGGFWTGDTVISWEVSAYVYAWNIQENKKFYATIEFNAKTGSTTNATAEKLKITLPCDREVKTKHREQEQDLNSKEMFAKPGASIYQYDPAVGVMLWERALSGDEKIYALTLEKEEGNEGKKWYKVKINEEIYYMKYAELQEHQASEEEIATQKDINAGVEDALNKEIDDANAEYEENTGISIIEKEDIASFEPGSGGVIIEGLAGTSGIADPTNALEVNTYNPNSDINLTEANSKKILELGKTVIGILNVIATVIAILVLTALGIKYMMGSIEEKAEYKETMMPYIIGAIFVFSSTTIVNFIYNFAITFNK